MGSKVTALWREQAQASQVGARRQVCCWVFDFVTLSVVTMPGEKSTAALLDHRAIKAVPQRFFYIINMNAKLSPFHTYYLKFYLNRFGGLWFHY